MYIPYATKQFLQIFSQTPRSAHKISEIISYSYINMESEQAPPIKETKSKRQLTEGQLEQLAKAREKANAVRKRNADMKRKEKELNEMERQAKEKALDKRLSKVSKAPKKKAMPIVEESSDDSDSDSDFTTESSSSSEEEPPPRRRRAKRAPVRRAKSKVKRYEEPDEPPAQPQPESQSQPDYSNRVYDQHMNRAFASLFPNYNV